MCESWRIFTNFLADMGGRPSEQHTLDRIDNSGDYEPGNCRWATKTQQTINQRLSARNSSGYRGVTWDAARNKWKVCVQVNHQNFNVGRFDDLRTAAWMRDQWAISLHDEDVHLNFDYQ